jgi:hypothetical protein
MTTQQAILWLKGLPVARYKKKTSGVIYNFCINGVNIRAYSEKQAHWLNEHRMWSTEPNKCGIYLNEKESKEEKPH